MSWSKHSKDSINMASRKFGNLQAFVHELGHSNRWAGTITAFGRNMRFVSGKTERIVKQVLTKELRKIADDIYTELDGPIEVLDKKLRAH